MIVAHANYLVSAGHDICIITAVFDSVFTLDSRISLKILPSSNKLITILSAVKSKFTSDLIIADIIPMACFLFLRYRCKVIYFAQDYDESYYFSRLQKGLIHSFYHIGLTILGIPTIAVSRHLADLLRKKFHANATVAENGVDTKVFYPDPDPELVAAKGNRKSVLLLSRSDWRKGFDIARTVVGRLSEVQSDIFEVWTVGEFCAGFFADIVHRDFGYVAEERLRRIMSSADLFFYPTRHEGFGLMPLEAFACCCPVVTTTAVPFAINGRNALVGEVNDIPGLVGKVRRLLDGESEASYLIAEGLSFAHENSLEACAKRFAQLIEHDERSRKLGWPVER